MVNIKYIWVGFVSLLLLFATGVRIATASAAITVNSDGDTVANDSICTLREAIANANSDSQSGSTDCASGSGTDTIRFTASLNNATITLTGGELLITDDISINGRGETLLTISGNDASRIFRTENSSLTVTDLTLTNGSHTESTTEARGGCIYLRNTGGAALALMLTNVTVQNCTINGVGRNARGGAISSFNRQINLTNVTLDNNHAMAQGNGGALGGAMDITSDSTLTFDNVTATNNLAHSELAARGGAFYAIDVTWNWTTGSLTGNMAESLNADAFGGAIDVVGDASADFHTLTIQQNEARSRADGSGGGLSFDGAFIGRNLTVTENSVTTSGTLNRLYGGGIYHVGMMTLTDSTVQHNRVFEPAALISNGGGMWVKGTITITNTQVVSNTAVAGGGIEFVPDVACGGQYSTLTGGTIEDNYASEVGGGFRIPSGSGGCGARLLSVMVTNNRADDAGGGVYLYSGKLLVEDSTISTNRTTSGRGGGIGTSTFQPTGILQNSSVTQNQAANGAGIAVDSGSFTVTSGASVALNVADSNGGGIFNNAQLTVVDATISENEAVNGGGIYNTATASLFDGAAVSANSAASGGGIYNAGTADSAASSQLTTHNAMIDGNTTTGSGGGIFNNGLLMLDGGSVSDNSAAGSGGGVIVADGSATLTNLTVAGNSGGFFGGGLTAQAPVTLTRSTFTDNIATLGGGAFFNDSDGQVANSTFSANEARSSGSGIYLFAGALTLTNVTVANGIGGSGVVNSGDTLAVGNSIIANNAGNECVGTITTSGLPNLATDTTCSASIVNASPNLGSLANNGGTTETHALLNGSPAIDAGNNAACSAFPVNGVDQRGFARPASTTCDLGALEQGAVVPTVVTLHSASAKMDERLLTGFVLVLLLTLVGLAKLYSLSRGVIGRGYW